MPTLRSWTDKKLIESVKNSYSYAGVIRKLGLIPAGGNYNQVKRRIVELKISTSHFKGKGWSSGLTYKNSARTPIELLVTKNSYFQSYKLKKRLFQEGLKNAKCKLCGWSKVSPDGRIPVELDHINGDRYDNRLENLRILCPNCHSLQLTHRGKNKKVNLARVVE